MFNSDQLQRAVSIHMSPPQPHSQQTMRSDIEQKLKRRAEIEDAVIVARENQLAQEGIYLKNARAAATQRSAMLSQLRKTRIEAKNLKIAVRDEHLSRRNNHTIHKISNAVPTAPLLGKEFGKKKVSIEQAQQHAHNLKECEKRRVANLEHMMHIVQVGDAIKHGDE